MLQWKQWKKNGVGALVAMGLIGALVPSAQAALLVSFDDTSGDLVVTLSGSFDGGPASTTTPSPVSLISDAAAGFPVIALNGPGPLSETIQVAGSAGFPVGPGPSTPFVSADSLSLAAFNIAQTPAGRLITVGAGAITYDPLVDRAVFLGATLDAIGLGGIPTTPALVFDGPGTNDILLVAVPEPSTLVLSALGLSGLALVRRRGRA